MAIPLIPVAAAAVAGGGLGFFAGGGADAIRDVIKYAVIGAGIYLVAKKTRVLR